MDAIFKSRLPKTAADGDQILDSNGSVYEFNLQQNEWVFIGQIPSPDIVNEELDGLVSPGIFKKISLIKSLINKGVDFSSFKLDSAVNNPYYYYFNSSDDLIKFSPEQVSVPKEVLFVNSITRIDDNGDSSEIFLKQATFTPNNFVGLVLESNFGSFDILSNSFSSVTVSSTGLALRVGDVVKIIDPELIKTRLRVEVDRGRLYQKLVRNRCVGPKGPDGDKGPDGNPGIAAEDEFFRLPSNVTDGVFAWDDVVDTPIDTPISLRIFRQDDDDNIIVEIIFPLSDGDIIVEINDETVEIEQTNLDISYNSDSKIFKGSISVTSGGDDIDTWRYKVRQVGPKGASGKDGKSHLEIVDNILDDPSLRSSEAVFSMRKSSVSDDIFLFNRSLFDEIPASSFGAVEGDVIRDIAGDFFPAAKVTISDAKDVGFYKFNVPDINIPELDLPLWTPTSDCVSFKRWASYKYDWFNRVDPNYLYKILLNPRPESDSCCQSDFFMCNNLGDSCEVIGKPATPNPIHTPCVCDCDNPISDSFGGEGYVIDHIDLTSPESLSDSSSFSDEDSFIIIGDGAENNVLSDSDIKSISIASTGSVIDGTMQRFVQEITFCGNTEIRVLVDFDPSICGGNHKERKDCAFVDSNAISGIFSLESIDGSSNITSATPLETKIVPTTVVFTASSEESIKSDKSPVVEPGQIAIPVSESNVPEGVENPEFVTADYAKSTLKLKIVFNTGEVDYCRGYRITVVAKSDSDSCSKSRTFIITDPGSSLSDSGVESGSEATGSEASTSESSLVDVSTSFITPEPSFAADGAIISGGLSPNDIIEQAQYGLEASYKNFSVSGTGDKNIFVTSTSIGVGSLTSSPSFSQVPIISDKLNNNLLLDVSQFVLARKNAGYDNGPFGLGTYILGSDIETIIYSRIPHIKVRTDMWTNVIGFFREPTNVDENFDFIVMAKLIESELHDSVSSVFIDHLFDNSISEGILVIRVVLQDDPMKAISDGAITFARHGDINITYSADDVAGDYPSISITALS